MRWRDSSSGGVASLDASHLMAHCENNFTTNLPLDILDDEETMFAWN